MTDTAKLRAGIVMTGDGYPNFGKTETLMRLAADEIESLRRKNIKLMNRVDQLQAFAPRDVLVDTYRVKP